MKKMIAALLLALALCLGAAAAEAPGFLGQPFPDFTAVDTEGNVFTLSEALKDHEAVLVNIWTTWCPPCEMEFPHLNEVYGAYGDRVAFIALSGDGDDTMEMIEEYRREHGIDFPMGRDEGLAVYRYTGDNGYPTTVVVDRFGNAAFCRVGCFFGAGEVTRVLEAFLGDDYTETTVLDGVPKETATAAFPVSAARALRVENESARAVVFREDGASGTQMAYVVDDDTARLRLEAAAGDNPADLIFYDQNQGSITELPALLDPGTGAYACEVAMPGAADGTRYDYVCLLDGSLDEDPEGISIYLIAGDAAIDALAEDMRSWGYAVSWEYADDAQPESAPAQAYTLHVIDQYGAPVPGVHVNFCTDETCTMLKSGEDGAIIFDGPPDAYHVQLLKVPEGYSFDADFEMVTDRVPGEWALRIRKD